MENSESGIQKPHTRWNPRQGGFRATMFVFVMSGLENIGFIANAVSLVLYFIDIMHFNVADSSTTLMNFMGATFLVTIPGGFISDTYLNRLNTILVFGIFEILGYVLLTIQAHKTDLQPKCKSCHIKGGGAYVLYLSLCMLALGFGGIRGALPALGADQFDRKHEKESRYLASFFNWLLLSVTLGASLGVTVVVWISTNKNWSLGFFISMLLALLGFGAITVGKPFYRVRLPGQSPLIRLLQVVVVAVRNRKLEMPKSSEELFELIEKDADGEFHEERIPHSDQFRWLDKAAILPQGGGKEQQQVCSVTQVEELKIVIRMLPILGSTIIMNTCLAQLQTFSVQQGNMMNLHLVSFNVPPPSIPVIPLAFMSLLIPLYEFLFVPLARKLTAHPAGITHLQRVAVGLVLSAVSMAVAAAVEVKRRNAFNRDHKQISLFWLSFQYGIFGIADMFTLVGLMNFFYSEAPAGMRSLSTSFSFLSLSFGYFLSSIFVNVVNSVTRRVTPSRRGWIDGQNLNALHLDLFYWFLSLLSCINFVVYLFCAKWYRYRNTITSSSSGSNSTSTAAGNTTSRESTTTGT